MPGTVYRHQGPGALADLQDFLLLFDWSRGWLARIPVGRDGTVDVGPESVEVIATGISGVVDTTVGPDGAVYVAQLGYCGSPTSRIGRISCASCGGAETSAVTTAVPWPRSRRGRWLWPFWRSG